VGGRYAGAQRGVIQDYPFYVTLATYGSRSGNSAPRTCSGHVESTPWSLMS
jgi:hypothetical protein